MALGQDSTLGVLFLDQFADLGIHGGDRRVVLHSDLVAFPQGHSGRGSFQEGTSLLQERLSLFGGLGLLGHQDFVDLDNELGDGPQPVKPFMANNKLKIRSLTLDLTVFLFITLSFCFQ